MSTVNVLRNFGARYNDVFEQAIERAHEPVHMRRFGVPIGHVQLRTRPQHPSDHTQSTLFILEAGTVVYCTKDARAAHDEHTRDADSITTNHTLLLCKRFWRGVAAPAHVRWALSTAAPACEWVW